MQITFRPGGSADADALAEIYRDAVRTTGAEFYDPEQIAVWAEFPATMEDFPAELDRGVTLVAEADGVPVAFGQLDPWDRIAFLYCRGSHGRQGICTRIYRELQHAAAAAGTSHLLTEASRASRPLFERLGFRVTKREEVERNGTLFERFRMRKELAQGLDAIGSSSS